MDRQGKKLVHTYVKNNDFEFFLKLVAPYRHDLTVCCECMFGWYWLSDACQEAGLNFVLAHALYVRAIHGGKTRMTASIRKSSRNCVPLHSSALSLFRANGSPATRRLLNWGMAIAVYPFVGSVGEALGRMLRLQKMAFSKLYRHPILFPIDVETVNASILRGNPRLRMVRQDLNEDVVCLERAKP